MTPRAEHTWWDSLRHSGLLLGPNEVRRIEQDYAPQPLPAYRLDQLRREINRRDAEAGVSDFVAWVLQSICGFTSETSSRWKRGRDVPADFAQTLVTGEALKPRQLWTGPNGGALAVFLDSNPKLGQGRGRKMVSDVLQWLRRARRPLALLTNGRQWRLLYAGLDFDAACEWDTDLWFEEGQPGAQLAGLRLLLQPALFDPPAPEAAAPLHDLIQASRRGQAELSALLGERVREAVEALVQAHGQALARAEGEIATTGADIYRAAVRVVMRMVVVLFAESRDLLPRDNPIYHDAYGLQGLHEQLAKAAVRGRARLAHRYGAWPRILALFRLIYEGSHHTEIPVPAYGGELFAPGRADARDPVARALTVFETACFDPSFELMPDAVVYRMLELLTRSQVRVRQGRATTRTTVPVEFSDLSSEYIGILYEGLLDYELRTAPAGEPIVFLAVGDEPALPLSRLEAMEGAQIRELFEKLKDKSRKGDEGAGDEEEAEEAEPDEEEADEPEADEAESEADEEPAEEESESARAEEPPQDVEAARQRALTWTRGACLAAGLITKPRGKLTPERQRAFDSQLDAKARQLVRRVVLPGEWYLVRWGGTRKGAGTFYTRPQLAVPTVHRTLRPLAYDPPAGADGQPHTDASAQSWRPKRPEEILALKVCDPACGSGSFPVAALRFLTDALYAALFAHGRLAGDHDRTVLRLLGETAADSDAALSAELIPCRPDDPTFEPRAKAVLRRHVVERCIYGVDLDPLAVELCRLALWIETMDRDLPFSFLDHKVRPGNSLIGCWFDQFQHYPVMAWKNREGGDKQHTNGVHYRQDERTKAIKAFTRDHLTPDLARFIGAPSLFYDNLWDRAATAHDEALATLRRLHELPVQDTAERARIYREEMIGSPAWQSIKAAFDLWCACWFWPADELDAAPLPSTLASPAEAARAAAERIAAEKRFFHWELEFPDVFHRAGSGFDAVLGNPPWDIAKPNSKEFFSNTDPLYRSYGKQEALRRQTDYFGDAAVERAWLEYNADFRGQSNFMKYSAGPFGDPQDAEKSQDGFSIGRGKVSAEKHAHWRQARAGAKGYADSAHPYRHQGSADINLYKMFLERGHALLRQGGRLGLIVPSGLYSDHGTRALRELFLEQCRWEWLFGFENREKIFDIHRSYKFGPVIVEKGGRTEAIRTAFMRRRLEDWEEAGKHATPYSRGRVAQFSPKSKAILEIQSKRDLEILEKIYANSVLLGDDGPDGWGIKYATEFHMTNDSKLFPPRPQWEAKGYKPDEYSRWLLGDWRPVGELWAELGVDPSRPKQVEIELEDWLFDSSAGPERRTAEARLVHGHLLKPGDVARTPWRVRCAQPPYDSLPIPRADIPAGVILSRDATGWIREEKIRDVALPLYQGRMIWQLDAARAQWTGPRSSDWVETPSEQRQIGGQFLMSMRHWSPGPSDGLGRLGFRDVQNATNQRTLIASLLPAFPCGNKVPLLLGPALPDALLLLSGMVSFQSDRALRLKMSQGTVNWFYAEEVPVLKRQTLTRQERGARLGAVGSLAVAGTYFSPAALALHQWYPSRRPWRDNWALSECSRVRLRALLDGLNAVRLGTSEGDLKSLLSGCDMPGSRYSEAAFMLQMDAKAFWRVDKNKDPELRHTVLTLVALHDLKERINGFDGREEEGLGAFLAQNEGEGWMLPETLCLADYGLGDDARARRPQPVASRLGLRYYDWQLAQTEEESWRECEVHARNMLGAQEFARVIPGGKRAARVETATPLPPATRATTSGDLGTA